jgi:hypothetical protein
MIYKESACFLVHLVYYSAARIMAVETQLKSTIHLKNVFAYSLVI